MSKMEEALCAWSESLQRALAEEYSALPAVHAIFGVLASPTTPMNGYEDFQKEGFVKKTIETLTLMINSTPPDQFFVSLMRYIKQAISSRDPFTRRAACLAALASCSDDDAHSCAYWEPCLPFVLQGITEKCLVVQNAAIFAFVRFGKILLQNNLQEHAQNVISALITGLRNLRQSWRHLNFKIAPHFSAFFEVVGEICGQCLRADNNSAKSVELLVQLLKIFDSRLQANVRRLALTALTRAVREVGVVSNLKLFVKHLHRPMVSDLAAEVLHLQVEIMDALNQTTSRSTFRSLAGNIFELVNSTIDKIDTRNGLRTACILVGHLHKFLSDEVEGLLKHVITTNLEILEDEGTEISEADVIMAASAERDSLASDELSNMYRTHHRLQMSKCESLRTINQEIKVSKNQYFSSCQQNMNTFLHPDSSPEVFIDKKERACAILQSVAEFSALIEFRPYFDSCFAQLIETSSHRNARIRSAALGALSSVCSVFTHHRNPNRSKVLLRSINAIVPRCADAIMKSCNEHVVFNALYALWNLMELNFNLSRNIYNVHLVVKAVTLILSGETSYQRSIDSRTRANDHNPNKKSLNSLLSKFCFDFISYVASCDDDMTTEVFAVIFEKLFGLMLLKAGSCSAEEQKLALDTLGYSIKRLEEHSGTYVNRLLPILLLRCFSVEDGVKGKALSAIAKYVCYGKEVLCPYYAQINNILERILPYTRESESLQSICVTIAGMICTAATSVSLDRLLPVFFRLLPEELNSRLPEYQHVIRCLVVVYELRHPLMADHIPVVTQVAYEAGIGGHFLKSKEMMNDAIKLICWLKQDFVERYEESLQSIPRRIVDFIHGNFDL